MTLFLRCIVLASFFLAQCAGAQGIIRSGEHGSFTRLVIPIAQVSTWSIVGEGRRRDLIFAPEISLKLDQIFQRINTNRIAQLSTTDDGYQISLNCDCFVEAFDYQQSYLVLDIYDAAPTDVFEQLPATPINQDVDSHEAVSDRTLNYRSSVDDGSPNLTLNTALQLGGNEERSSATASTLTLGLRHNLLSPNEVNNPFIANEMNAASESISEISGEIARQIARASSSHLLQPHSQLSQSLRAPMTEQPLATNNLHQLPIRSATAFDIAINRDQGLNSDVHHLTCDQPITRISEWSLDIGFEQQLGELRAQLFDTNGDIIVSRALNLARYYIFYGFGAEAEHWIIEVQELDLPELAMSRYLNGESGQNFTEINSTALCSGQDILWRFIDGSLYLQMSDEDIAKLIRAFLELPATLRRRIGPNLVRQLHDAGHQSAAEDLREAISIGSTLTEHEELSLALEIGSHSPLDVELNTVLQMLENSSTQTPYRMARYLAAARAHSLDVPIMAQEAAEALLIENNSSYDSNGLWYELALTYASMNDVSSLIELIDSTPSDETAARSSLIQSAFEILLERQLDASTLVLAIRTLEDPSVDRLDQVTRNQISQVLVRLGLNSIAQQYGYHDIEYDTQSQLTNIVEIRNQQTHLPSQGIEANIQQINEEISAHRIQTLLNQSSDLRNRSHDLIGQ